MPSPQEIYDSMVAEARAKVEAEQAAKVQQAAAGQDEMVKTVKSIGEVLPKIADNQKQLADRLAALEATRTTRPTETDENDPYKHLTEDLGITRGHIAPVVQHEVGSAVEKAVDKVFETRFGPALRQTAAIQGYQEQNPDFDLNRLNKYLSVTPDVKAMVERSAKAGAYDLGIAYAETRRQMDEKIHAEATVHAKGASRKRMVEETRPDAAILGGTGANGTSRTAAKPTMTADQLEKVFANLEAGNSQPFEQAFVHPGLPSEEWFQKLAQS